MIKYLGSKRALLPRILAILDALPTPPRAVLDLFSGTSRVGHACKARGWRVLANDHNAYATTLARCYIAADRDDLLHDATILIAELNEIASRATLPGGWFTRTYCEEARYLQPANGVRIEAVREAIARKRLEPELEAVLLTSLVEAADRVDSTTGLQMAFLKSWSRRSHNELSLRVPDLLPRSPFGKGEAHQLDALDAAKSLEADVAYIDPPYNQHSYLGNYHLWESLVRWDNPEVYGVARKRLDVRTRPSAFNSRRLCHQALRDVLHAVRAPTIILSFSDEGHVPRHAMETMLSELFQGRARVSTHAQEHRRYIGSQIGIYSPQGEKVGRVSHTRNREFLYVVTREPVPAFNDSLLSIVDRSN